MNNFQFSIFNFQKSRQRGFTLIELLVVISIIGVLAALTLVSFSGAQKQTRDTERRSDLNQYRNALENYAASNDGAYPTLSAGDVTDTACNGNDGALDPFLSSCPADPNNADGYLEYQIWSNGSDYTLWADLESGGYWVVCSNGKSGGAEAAPTGACNL